MKVPNVERHAFLDDPPCRPRWIGWVPRPPRLLAALRAPTGLRAHWVQRRGDGPPVSSHRRWIEAGKARQDEARPQILRACESCSLQWEDRAASVVCLHFCDRRRLKTASTAVRLGISRGPGGLDLTAIAPISDVKNDGRPAYFDATLEGGPGQKSPLSHSPPPLSLSLPSTRVILSRARRHCHRGGGAGEVAPVRPSPVSLQTEHPQRGGVEHAALQVVLSYVTLPPRRGVGNWAPTATPKGAVHCSMALDARRLSRLQLLGPHAALNKGVVEPTLRFFLPIPAGEYRLAWPVGRR